MDYEKAYKSALEKAKNLLANSVAYDRFTIERIFPELKESEDERIRKVLVDFFKSYKEQGTCGAETFNGISTSNILAWLEKQGEKKSADKVEPKFKVKFAGNEYNVLEIKEFPGGIIYYGIEDEPNHIDYILPENCEIISGYGVKEKGNSYQTKSAIFSEQNPAWLEKQGEQKPVIDFKAKDWYVSKVDGKIHDMTYNPADKVEPRFKVKYAGSEYNVLEVK